MSAETKLRALTSEEIDDLEKGGSRAADWGKVRVMDGFVPTSVARCTFSGNNTLGVLSGTITTSGAPMACGVYDAHLHNVNVADGALVCRVGLLSNYDVGHDAAIVNCGTVSVEGETAFGNGVEVEVLNEGGGREVLIYDTLTAQIAYLAACYRHRSDLAPAIAKLTETYVASRKSTRGAIGEYATVRNCTSVVNVAVGAHATVDGALELSNGTIASNEEAATTVGVGVVASNFIVCTGSKVDGGAMLKNVFVGQGCKIGRQFSAEQSVFFANCEGFHGEAVSLLAGPYSVTHHKSTLLIANVLSFFNAGSGTNQSNHMYKMGPVHQGTLGRGSKTGSFSYLLWPSQVGAFTAVMGKHYANFDTRNLPFSYITDDDGRSVISPAINLFTVGTRRDGEKWPKRDRRSDPIKLDEINFEVFSPYTIGRVMKGLSEITELYENAPRKQEYVNYKGISIKRLLCRTAKKHYTVSLKVYFGDILVSRLEKAADPAGALEAPSASMDSEWVDVLGMTAPKTAVEAICVEIEKGAIKDLNGVRNRFAQLHRDYGDNEWAWANAAYKEHTGKTLCELTSDERATLIAEWRDARTKLNLMIQNDAEKEFDVGARLGFGIDGGTEERDADFTAVRGTAEDSSFIVGLKKESEDTTHRAEALLASLTSK